MSSNENEVKLRDYLLGSVSEVDREQIERRLMVEDEFFGLLEATEDDLIDEYVSEDFNPTDRNRFEKNFLTTTERRKDVEFARQFRHYLKKPPVPRPNPIIRLWTEQRIALSATLLVIIGVVIGGLWWSRNANHPRTFTSLALTIVATTRGDGASISRIRLPVPTDTLRISLALPKSETSAVDYRVVLSHDGYEPKPVPVVTKDQRSITVDIPSGELQRGEYALKVVRINSDHSEQPLTGSYFFIAE